jgi:hypothetical protein
MLPSWTTKTTTYSAASGDHILADTSGGAFTITLPGSPSAGTQIMITDASGSFGTNNLTVANNSLPIMGVAANWILNTNNANIELVYYNSTYGWRIMAMQPATIGLLYSYGEVR